jgi:peptidoglycan hydrolase-like protein with peptidoglycan-binding domain
MRETTLESFHSNRRWTPSLGPLALFLLFLLTPFDKASAQRLSHPHIKSPEIIEAEQRLADLGYWTGPVDGVFDAASKHALIAFQKMEGHKRTGVLTTADLEALRSASRPAPRDNSYAHIEVDLKRQVLLVVDAEGIVTRVLPVCTGNEQFYLEDGRRNRAHTPRGRFTVTRKINGWRRSKLGLLYYPSYIINGIAIHGSQSIMTYPASHGCIRIPMFAAKELSEMAPVGTVVVVYDDG